jgi:hypothetical protein
MNRARSANASIKSTPHSSTPLRGYTGNIERWDARSLSRTDNEGRPRKARDDNRSPRPLHYDLRHSRQQATERMARTDPPPSTVSDRAKIECFALDPHPIQELVESSRLAKGSVIGLVEDSHHDRRRKKIGKTTGNLRTEMLEENKPFSKATSGAAHRKSHSKPKPKLVEKVSYDVYIPKNITVANLARLLNIKHSTQNRIFYFLCTPYQLVTPPRGSPEQNECVKDS